MGAKLYSTNSKIIQFITTLTKISIQPFEQTKSKHKNNHFHLFIDQHTMKFSLTVLSTALLIPFSEGFDLQDNWNIEDVLATNTGKEFTFQYPGTKKDFLTNSFGTEYDEAESANPGQTNVTEANPNNKVMNKVRATWYGGDTCKVVSEEEDTAGTETSQSYGTEGYGAAFIPYTGVELFSDKSLGWSTKTTVGEKKICIPEMYEYLGDSNWKTTNTKSCDTDGNNCVYQSIDVDDQEVVTFNDCPTLSNQKLGWSQFESIDGVDVNDQGFIGFDGLDAVIADDDTLLELKFKTVTAEIATVDVMNTNVDPTARSNEMKFCVRIGLFTGDQEINFLETVVTLTVTMSGDFSVDAFNVAPKEKTTTTAAQSYSVTAELCGNTYGVVQATKGIGGSFNQGSAISVCIFPKGDAITDGVFMRSVDKFEWNRADIGQDQSVINQLPSADAQFATLSDVISSTDGLSQIYLRPALQDMQVIVVTSVLFAAFYTTAGQVTASGSASMEFPTSRRLRDSNGRNLQEDDEPLASAFDFSAGVNKAEDGPAALTQTAGGAATSITVVGTIIGLVSALLFA